MTVSPTRDEFVALAADHGVVPVWRELLADLETPLSVYARLRGDGPTFLLESAEHGERWGRYSFVGTDPFLVLRGRDGEVTWEGTPPAGCEDADGALDALARATQALRAPEFPLLPLHGGAVGMVGYDAVREVEDIPATGEDDLGLPDVTEEELIPSLIVAAPRTMVAVLTGRAAEDREASARAAGAFTYYEKEMFGTGLFEYLEQDCELFSRAVAGEDVVAPSAISRRRQ